MKLKLIGAILACSILSNCVHVSSKGMTAFGTDMENVNYVANPPSKTKSGKDGPSSETGGYVAFSASKVNNSESLGKVTNAAITAVSVWGTVKAIEGSVKAYTAKTNAATAQANIAAKKSTDLAKIAAEKELGLAGMAAHGGEAAAPTAAAAVAP